MIISYITLLTIDKAHADDVVAILTNVSNDFNIVVRVLYFFIPLFGFVVSVFEVCNHPFNVIDLVVVAVNIN